MDWTPETKAFIVQHLNDDTDRLLLSAHRYPGVDMPFVVDQILARRQLKNKLPEWAANDDLIMGGRVPAEQCSSEQTALYKQSLVKGASICDMTGGMGVDLFYMSRGLKKAIYTERQHHLCENARHNFSVLGADNIEIREGDGQTMPIPDVDTICLDPARRANDGSRVYDLASCEPNVVEWQEELLSHCKRLVVKMSPMADVSRVLKLMPAISQIHIVGVKGECKEVLAVCDKEIPANDVEIFCVDMLQSRNHELRYRVSEEENGRSAFAEQVGTYLYEPDVCILKAGAFKTLCSRFDILKLDVNSHLYTSDVLVPDFPGRVFLVDERLPFSSKSIKSLSKAFPKANITARNFPMTADELRKRSGIKDGGDIYLFATMLKDFGNILLKCRKALLSLLFILCLIPEIAMAASNKNEASVEQMFADIATLSPYFWQQGKEFVCLKEKVDFTLVPEIVENAVDTVDYKGSVWKFDAIISEEDWMGQQTMALRFMSPSDKAYRFSTNRLMSQASDTTYIPSIFGLYPKSVIDEVDEILRARTLYILINDDRISDGDTIRHDKFVKVNIDSVTYGIEQAPIKVFFRYENGVSAYIYTSLPGSRETQTSTVINKYFSVNDPFKEYPNITEETWSLIQRSQVKIDMTREECRLSLGRPQRVSSYNTKAGVLERWLYPGKGILEFVDGRLIRMGRDN